MTYQDEQRDGFGSQVAREQTQTLESESDNLMDFRSCSYEEKTSV